MKSFRSLARRNNPAPENLVRLFQSETAEILETPEPAGVRVTVYVLGGFIVSLIVLAAFVRLDRVVYSAGQIVTTQSTMVVQALDPSIIKTVDVREGQRVKAGNVLATLDPTFASADVSALKSQVANLDAQIARAEAELAKRPYVPPPITDPAATQYGELQKSYYTQRKAQFDSQLRAYDEQIAQLKTTIAKLGNDQVRYGDRARLAKEVEDMRATLAAAQVGSRLNLLAATDTKTELLRYAEFAHNSLIENQHQLRSTISNREALQQWLAQASQEAGHRARSAGYGTAAARKGDKAQGSGTARSARGCGCSEDVETVGGFGPQGGRSADVPGAAGFAGGGRGQDRDPRCRLYSRRRSGDGEVRHLQFHRTWHGRRPTALDQRRRLHHR
jgi:HlyD family secretion protein